MLRCNYCGVSHWLVPEQFDDNGAAVDNGGPQPQVLQCAACHRVYRLLHEPTTRLELIAAISDLNAWRKLV